MSKNTADDDLSYISFLLRLWLAEDDGEPARRASLESPLTGELEGFTNLDDLCSYLRLLLKNGPEETHNNTDLY